MSSARSRIFPTTGHEQNAKRDGGDQFLLNHLSRSLGNSAISFAYGSRISPVNQAPRCIWPVRRTIFRSHAGAFGYPPPPLFSSGGRGGELQPGGQSAGNFATECFAANAGFGSRSSRTSFSAPWETDSAYSARSDFSGARTRSPSSVGEFSPGTQQRTRRITGRVAFGCYPSVECAARAASPWAFYGRS